MSNHSRPNLPSSQAARLARDLTLWFQKKQRPMPWRRTHDPYRIWLSEVMLQQTRVSTVIPYYEKFTKRFPRVEKLAAAPLGEVLKLWAGMGYYARARQLHKAARIVAKDLGGEFPGDAEGLQKLPGVGAYTAGAIASIAFEKPEPAVDGNVVRVLSRFLAWPADTASPKDRESAAPVVRAILERGSPRILTQALMELGATICAPALPACADCPLRSTCRARRNGAVEEFPRTVPRKKPLIVHLAALAAVDAKGRVLAHRPTRDGLFGGLWQLPKRALREGESALDAARTLAEGFGIKGKPSPVTQIRHVLSHRDLRISLYSLRASRTLRAKTSSKWIAPADTGAFALSSLERKLLEALRGRPLPR